MVGDKNVRLVTDQQRANEVRRLGHQHIKIAVELFFFIFSHLVCMQFALLSLGVKNIPFLKKLLMVLASNKVHVHVILRKLISCR